MDNLKNIRITLAQLLSISSALLIALLSLLFYVLLRTSQDSIVQASDNLRSDASRAIAEKVTSYFNQAQQIENSFQSEIKHQVFNPKDPIAVETTLFALLLTNDNLSEISFIYGEKIGNDPEGNILLALTDRGEISLFRRSSEKASPIDTLYTHQEKGQWVIESRVRSAQNDLFGAPFVKEETNSKIS